MVNELTINMMYTWRNVVRLRFLKNEVYGEVFFYVLCCTFYLRMMDTFFNTSKKFYWRFDHCCEVDSYEFPSRCRSVVHITMYAELFPSSISISIVL